MKCYSEGIISGLLFTVGGLDQTTHPLCGFTFRTEAALCLRWGRLHIHIHALHRPGKGMTHESLMSGVCVECAVFAARDFGKQYSRACVKGSSTIKATRLRFLTRFSFFYFASLSRA